MQGQVFVDHLDKDLSKYKVGERVQARVISHDFATKSTGLSLLPHIVQMTAPKQTCHVGASFSKVKVAKLAYGGSYLLKLPEPHDSQMAFLHKSHLPGAEQEVEKESSDSDGEEKKKKKPKKVVDELTQGQVVDKVRVKEINYFDNCVQMTMRS
jgi:hypothetical protein